MSYPVWRSNRGGGWDSFADVQVLRSELGRLMRLATAGGDVDVDDDEDGWVVTVRLPGVAPEEVAIEVDDRELLVRARSEAEVDGDADGSRRRAFEHRVATPADVDAERVDAVMDHGLLTVRLPRAARRARRTIEVGRARRGSDRQATGGSGPGYAGTDSGGLA
jgi:HSP20 family protein